MGSELKTLPSFLKALQIQFVCCYIAHNYIKISTLARAVGDRKNYIPTLLEGATVYVPEQIQISIIYLILFQKYASPKKH